MKLSKLIKYYKNYIYSILYIITDIPGSEGRKAMLPFVLIFFTLLFAHLTLGFYINFLRRDIAYILGIFFLITYLLIEMIRQWGKHYEMEKEDFFKNVDKYSIYIIIAKCHIIMIILGVALFCIKVLIQ